MPSAAAGLGERQAGAHWPQSLEQPGKATRTWGCAVTARAMGGLQCWLVRRLRIRAAMLQTHQLAVDAELTRCHD